MRLPLSAMRQDFLYYGLDYGHYEGTWYNKDFYFICDAINDNFTCQFVDWKRETECIYRIELSRVLTMDYKDFAKLMHQIIYYNSHSISEWEVL